MVVTLAMFELLTSPEESQSDLWKYRRVIFPFGLKASLVWQFIEPWAILHTVVSSPSLSPFNPRFFNPFLLLAFSHLFLLLANFWFLSLHLLVCSSSPISSSFNLL